MHTELDQTHEEGHGLRPRQYAMIGVILAVITVIELAVSYADISLSVMVPTLLFLSAVKFVMVVAFFMHLKFDSPLLSRVFTGSFLLAVVLFVAVMIIFWFDKVPA